jgi:hypothetical protein
MRIQQDKVQIIKKVDGCGTVKVSTKVLVKEGGAAAKISPEVLASMGQYVASNTQITNHEEEIAALKSCLNDAKVISNQIIELRKYIYEESIKVSAIEDVKQRAWEFAGLRATEGRIEELEEELTALLK